MHLRSPAVSGAPIHDGVLTNTVRMEICLSAGGTLTLEVERRSLARFCGLRHTARLAVSPTIPPCAGTKECQDVDSSFARPHDPELPPSRRSSGRSSLSPGEPEEKCAGVLCSGSGRSGVPHRSWKSIVSRRLLVHLAGADANFAASRSR